MKAKKVLKILRVTRPTLTSYVKRGKLRGIRLPNGTYEYNDSDVYSLANLAEERYSVIYSRVSTPKQKVDLDNQEKLLIDFCNSRGVKVYDSYKEIGSGINFDRKEFQRLLSYYSTIDEEGFRFYQREYQKRIKDCED